MITLKDLMTVTKAEIYDGNTGKYITLQDMEREPNTKVLRFEIIDKDSIKVYFTEV